MAAASRNLGYRAVLRLPGVGRLVTASVGSRLAESAFAVAIVLYTLDRFHSPALAGAVAFTAAAPGLALSPVAGAVLDRVGAARAITIDLLASAILVLTLVAADRTGTLAGWSLLLLAGLYGLTSPLHLAGVRALLPGLVPPRVWPRVNAVDASSYAVVDVAGPVLAGGLFAVAAPWVTLAVIGGLYLVAAVVLAPLVSRTGVGAGVGSGTGSGPESAAGHAHLLRAAVAGLGYVLRHPTLRPLAGSYSLYQVSWGVLVVSVPVAMHRELASADAAELGTGLLWALVGVSAAAGALVAGWQDGAGRERRWIASGTLATAVAIYPVAGLGGLPWFATGLALVGLCSGWVDVGTLTLRQRRTDPERLGRVLAISISANTSGLPLGALLGGMLLSWSLPAALAAAATAAACSALVARAIPADP